MSMPKNPKKPPRARSPHMARHLAGNHNAGQHEDRKKQGNKFACRGENSLLVVNDDGEQPLNDEEDCE
jgi:hypothetical protein